MTTTLTRAEFSLYALMFLKFTDKEFDLAGIKWHFSKSMFKKLVFNLRKAGWLKAIGMGKYACVMPQTAVSGLFDARAENALKHAGMPYCFTKASAAEIWGNETYIQRSWEFHPLFIKIQKKDLNKWEKFLERNQITCCRQHASFNILGEFVVLIPADSMKIDFHCDKPVEPLDETIAYCESNRSLFGYALAYFSKKYGKKTSASLELLAKVREAI